MPDWLQAVLLGVIQGLTEFLPVSSSGHLVLIQEWMGDRFFASGDEVFFDLVLHLGTLVPVLWFYRRDLRDIVASPPRAPGIREAGGLLAWLRADPSRWLLAMVVLATIPTGLIGVALEDEFERLFSSVAPVCAALATTGLLLYSTRLARPRGGESDAGGPPRPMPSSVALAIGTIQGLAITPGISRSGSTISLGIFLGLDRADAARFSFLLSVPAILGAVVLKARHGLPEGGIDWIPVVAGFLTSMVVGYGALVLLVAIVKRGGLHRFAWYVWALAIIGFLGLHSA